MTEDQYRAVFEQSLDAMIIADQSGQFVQLNRAAGELLGYAPEQLIGKSVADLITAEDPPAGSRYQEYLERGMEIGIFRFVRPDGAIRTAEYRATQITPDLHLSVLRDITAQSDALQERERRLEQQREIADMLQEIMLTPSSVPEFDHLELAWECSTASDYAKVGGDFVDVFLLADDLLAIVVGDATGKGVGAAQNTVETKFTLRAILRETASADQALNRLNGILCRSAELRSNRPAKTFIALTLLLVNVKTAAFTISSGGAEPPFLMRGGIVELPSNGMLLGAHADAEYPVCEDTLGAGDLLVLTTDGITEARQGDRFFSQDGVARAVSAAAGQPLPQIATRIVQEAISHAGGSLHDDACVMLIRRK